LLLYWVEGSDWNVGPGTYATVAPQAITLTVGGMGDQDDAKAFAIGSDGSLTAPSTVRFLDNAAHLTATDEVQFLTFEPAQRRSMRTTVRPRGSTPVAVAQH
jgi:hypothetical protein